MTHTHSVVHFRTRALSIYLFSTFQPCAVCLAAHYNKRLRERDEKHFDLMDFWSSISRLLLLVFSPREGGGKFIHLNYTPPSEEVTSCD